KRNNHVFFDDKVCVKIDWLEQLNRHYVQQKIVLKVDMYCDKCRTRAFKVAAVAEAELSSPFFCLLDNTI
ncbi:hypothetical protein GIB67_034679, partial [Kingdonia uniflora]